MRAVLFLSGIIMVMALLLSGCSDFDEMKGQRALMQAEALLEGGEEEQAVQALTALLERFPSTQSGDVARQHLRRIEIQRERRERMAFSRVLDSYQQVLDGYMSLYAEYPRSAETMDQSDYFFDSPYLEDVTPEGYRVYLLLHSDGSGFRAWGTFRDKERGYSVASGSRVLTMFDRDRALSELRAKYVAADWGGKLVLLRSKE